jgi:hypothetical protein
VEDCEMLGWYINLVRKVGWRWFEGQGDCIGMCIERDLLEESIKGGLI